MSDREKSKFMITAFSVVFYIIAKYILYIQSKEKYDVMGLNCHQTLSMQECWPDEK